MKNLAEVVDRTLQFIIRVVDPGIAHTHPPFLFVFTSAREMIEFIVILVKIFIITLEINSEDVNTTQDPASYNKL